MQPARGLAALATVLLLFFVMALVAAYSNRNMVFEQRVAANSQRAERALMAADGAIDWALTMLNGGRINDLCEPTSSITDRPFRERYLQTPGAAMESAPRANDLYAGCIVADGATTCNCAAAAGTATSAATTALLGWDPARPATAFRLRFVAPGGTPREAAIGIELRGCGSAGQGDGACFAERPEVDGIANAQALLAYLPPMTRAPTAVITSAGQIDLAGVIARVSNPDGDTGVTLHARRNVLVGAGSQISAPAGAGDRGIVDNDSALERVVDARPIPLSVAADDPLNSFFVWAFGQRIGPYRDRPSTVRLDCRSGCTLADVQSTQQAFPGRAIWAAGDVHMDATPTGGSLGSALTPLLLIVEGNLRFNAPGIYQGLFYGRNVTWEPGAATAELRGSIYADGDFRATGNFNAVYDAEGLGRMHREQGTWVRALSGWGLR